MANKGVETSSGENSLEENETLGRHKMKKTSVSSNHVVNNTIGFNFRFI